MAKMRSKARVAQVPEVPKPVRVDADAALHPDRLSDVSRVIPPYTLSHAGYVVAGCGEEVFLRLNEDGDWRIRRLRHLTKFEVPSVRCKLTADMQWVDVGEAERAGLLAAINEATT